MNIGLYTKLQEAESLFSQIDEMTFEHAEYGTFVWKDENRDELQFFITNTEMKKLIKTLNKLKGLK